MMVVAVPIDGEDQELEIGMGGVVSATGAFLVESLVNFVRFVFDVLLLRISLMSLADLKPELPTPDLVHLIPDEIYLIQPLLDVAYEIILLAGKFFTAVLYFLFSGIPRCQGPSLLFAGMCLISITLVLIRWLNYDYFGLYQAAKQCVKTTKPSCQRTVSVGFVIGFQTFVFTTMQCVMLLFARSLLMANPLDANTWQCPYDNQDMSIVSGWVLIVVTGVGGIVLCMLCANGHFLGKNYVTKKLADFLEVDLTALDREKTMDPEHNGLFRWTTALSMLPTTFGFWFDDWNVKGYLIKERAEIYAKQLGTPAPCSYCGEIHVPYEDVIRATGMQLSLAYQLLPFGLLVGKGCEYLNRPPLYYRGKTLKCLGKSKVLDKAHENMPKSKKSKRAVLVATMGLCAAYLRVKTVPWLRRTITLTIYILVLICTFSDALRESILSGLDSGAEDFMRFMFNVALTLASMKAFFDCLMPAICCFVVGVCLAVSSKRLTDAALKKDFRHRRPMVGQVVHGAMMGTTIAMYMEMNGTKQSFLAGVGVALMVALFSAGLGLLVQDRADAMGTLPKMVYVAVLGCSMGSIHSSAGFRKTFIVSLCSMISLMLATMSTFRPLGMDEDGFREPSAVLPLLKTWRAMPGLLGTCAGTYAGSASYDPFHSIFNQYIALLACYIACVLVGVGIAFAIDGVVENKAVRWAILVGSLVSMLVGPLIHPIVGMFLGSVVGSLLGGFLEKRLLKEARKKQFAQDAPPPDRNKNKRSSIKIAAMLALSSLQGKDKESLNLTTEQKEELQEAERKLQGAQLALENTKEQHKINEEKANQKAHLALKYEQSDKIKSITLLPSKEKQERLEIMERAKTKVKATAKLMRAAALASGQIQSSADNGAPMPPPLQDGDVSSDDGLRQAALGDAPNVLALPDHELGQATNDSNISHQLVSATDLSLSQRGDYRSPAHRSDSSAALRESYGSHSGRTREDMERDWEAAKRAQAAVVAPPVAPRAPMTVGRTLRPDANKASPGAMRRGMSQQRTAELGVSQTIKEESSAPMALPPAPRS